MEAIDRSLSIVLLIAAASLVAGSPVLAATALGLVIAAGLFALVPATGALEAERELDAIRIVEGAPVRDIVRLSGRVHLPMLVTAGDRMPLIGEPEGPPSASRVGFGSLDVEHEVQVQLPVRGMAHFGPARVDTVDPLGLTRRSAQAEPAETVRVWPRAEDLQEHPLRSRYERMLAGFHPVRNPGASLNFYGIREYMPSDPMRSVNWKATAGKSEMMVNQYEHETYSEVTLFLDQRRITGVGTYRDMPLHTVCRAAASFATAVRGQQDVLRAYAFGSTSPKRFKSEPGRPWDDQLNDWLAELEPEGQEPVTSIFDEVLPHLTPRSIIVFISPLIGEDPLGQAPARALALENTVIALCPPIPDGIPEDLRDELNDQRDEGIEAARDLGVEVVDLARTPTLDQAFDEHQVMQR